MENKVSIITPNYNCELFICKTIESVLAQTYSNWEMLIVDDCSTDNSYKIALEYSRKDSRIKVLRNNQRSGAAISRNNALEIACGEYIAFLDSDDLWEPNKLEVQLSFMKEKECDFSFTCYDLIDEKGTFLGKEAKVVNKLNYYKLLHHDYIGCLTAMYKFEIAKNIRSYNIRNNNDYGLFLQIVRLSKNAMGINKTLAHYRIHKSGISRKKIKKIIPFFELMIKYLHIPIILSFWFLFTNILIGKIWKYKRIKYQEKCF